MGDVISFRPSAEDEAIIEQARRQHRFTTRAEAIRYLIRRAAKGDRFRDSPLGRFRIEGLLEDGEDLTSETIDETVYGDEVWSDE